MDVESSNTVSELQFIVCMLQQGAFVYTLLTRSWRHQLPRYSTVGIALHLARLHQSLLSYYNSPGSTVP
jgi:hypothetical protein